MIWRIETCGISELGCETRFFGWRPLGTKIVLPDAVVLFAPTQTSGAIGARMQVMRCVRSFTTVPDEPRNDRVQHNTDSAKDVHWHGLSRPRRPSFRPGEVFGIGIHVRASYRSCSRIELPRREFLTGSGGVGFSFSGFLRRFRLCPLAGLSFGHVFFAFFGCFLEL